MANQAHRTFTPKFEGRTTVVSIVAMTGNVISTKFAKRKRYAPIHSTGGRRA